MASWKTNVVVSILALLPLHSAESRQEHTVEFSLKAEDALLTAQTVDDVRRFNRMLPSYSLMPGDDAKETLKAFDRRANALELEIPLDSMMHQVDRWRGESNGIFPAKMFPELPAPIPFSFYRYYDRVATRKHSELESATRDIIEHCRQAIMNARSGVSRLLQHTKVLNIQGMSDDSVRHLMNGLAGAPGTRYLEIGSWRGSTLASALAGNEAAVEFALAVDAWMDWKHESGKIILGTGAENEKLCREAISEVVPDARVALVKKDFRDISHADVEEAVALAPSHPKSLKQTGEEIAVSALFNLYLFDGPHEYQDHFDALSLLLPRLEDVFIYCVDDWNTPDVPLGTFDAFKRLGLQVIWGEILGGGRESGEYGIWHNGFSVWVLEKNADL